MVCWLGAVGFSKILHMRISSLHHYWKLLWHDCLQSIDDVRYSNTQVDTDYSSVQRLIFERIYIIKTGKTPPGELFYSSGYSYMLATLRLSHRVLVLEYTAN